MQEIILYATANEVLARVRDRANAKAATPPTLARGCGFRLRIRLFANAYDDTPYPLSNLANITSWAFVMDSDWDSATPFKIVADAGEIAVGEVQDQYEGEVVTYTEAVVPVSETNTEELAAWLGSDEGKDGLNAELIGYDGTGEEAFVLQIKGFSVRNRLGSVGDPTPIPSEYLNADQVRALIASGAVLQFSPDGATWKDTQEDGDIYLRFRSASDASAAWSPAIALPRGANGADGESAFLYVRYASDAEGTGFSATPSPSLPFVGILATDTALNPVDASAFSGLWVRYLGDGTPGKDGASAYIYVAYASDSMGSNFSLSPTSGLKYRAELHTNIPLESPNAADFSGVTWVKYLGDDGAGAGDMLKAVYDLDDDGVVDSAAKLATPRKIGAANFDGTGNISLSDMGAQPALPTNGEDGQFLQKTAVGVKWATPPSTGGGSGASWGQITGDIQSQADLQSALDAKADSSALTNYAAKSDSLAGYGITDAYTKGEVDAKVSAVYRYKGSVATYAELPTEGNTVGDVWNVAAADEEHGIKAGDNVAWTGSAWDALSGTVDLTPYATKDELSTGLSGKADSSHTHAMGDITGLPASGGTAGQVLTKTATGAEWADAPSGGTSGEGGTDAGAVRYVKDYNDYLAVSELANKQNDHYSVLFQASADISGDFIKVKKSVNGDVVDNALRKGRTYLRYNPPVGSNLQERTVSTSTYVVEKVKFVSRDGTSESNTCDLLSGREDDHYIFPDSFEKASQMKYGFTFKDRETADASLNGGWPTKKVDVSTLISAYKAELEKEGTYIGKTPWYLADTNVGITNYGPVFKKSGGAWIMGSVYCDPSLTFSESFDENTKFDLVFLYKDSTGSYVETPTPNATETTTENNGQYTGLDVSCNIDITPDPLRLAIQALEGTALEVSPGKAYSATLTANATLTAAGGEEGYRQEAFLDVNPGAFTLTPGSGISFAKDLTAGKVNHCRIVWTGTSARLLVDDVTDAPASGGESGGGSEGTGGGGETGGGGSEDPGGDTPADGWPTKIVISGAASTQGSDVAAFNGDYVRTGETLTILGETVPIWSNGSKYIYGMSSSMGSDLNEPAIALQDSTGQNDAYMSYYYRMKSGSSWERADAAFAIGFTANITEEGGGSESGGSSDPFPTTFTVTACSGNDAAKGEYTRTGGTTTVGGKDYPVYSFTQAILGTTFYIYVCQYRQGSSGAFWSLKDGSYSASDEGYSGLGSVAVDTSTGLPMAETWEASGKQATVTWA